MSFLNKAFLIGLAAVALPILIHLLTRDRIRKVAFSTLRFFARSSGRILRRKRFQEAMLLALRMLILAAVAVAFAQPFFRPPEGKEAQTGVARKARVIVADVSGSIGQSGSGEALRKAAQEALKTLDEGVDAAALVTFADTPQVGAAMANDFAAARSKIDSLKPGQGGTDIVEALRLADGLLAQVKAGKKEIVLVSDLQKSGWVGGGKAATFKLAGDVRLDIKPLPAPGPALVLSEIDCPESLVVDNAPRTVAVKLLNQTPRELKDLPVTLAIGGKVIATRKVNLKANAAGAVRFVHLFDNPGDNAGLVYLGAEAPEAAAGKGALEKVFFNVRVIPRIRVVVLNGTPSADPIFDGAFFIEKALAPDANSSFAVRVVPAAEAKPGDVADAQVVIAANVSQLAAPMRKALGGLLQRGGGLLLLPGETVDPKEFNATFAAGANLAPCRLRSVLMAEGHKDDNEVVGAQIAKVNFDHPIFEIFLHPHYGDFATTRFFRWWEISDSQTSAVLARFDDNRPAVLERQIGRGISMLLASSPDLRWSNFPLRAIYLPYLHQTVRYLAIRTERKTAFQVGQVVEAPPGRQLKGPTGNVLADKEGKAALREVGICTWTGPDGKVDYSIAVNAAREEGASATVSKEEIAAAVARPPGEGGAEAGTGDVDDSFLAKLDRHRIWWYLAAAAGLMFVLELLMANKTLRH